MLLHPQEIHMPLSCMNPVLPTVVHVACPCCFHQFT